MRRPQMLVACFFVAAIFSINVLLARPEKDTSPIPNLQWKFSTSRPVYASPIVYGETVYFGGLDSTLYAINIAKGQPAWRFKTKGEIRSAICTAGDMIYLNGGDGNLYALGIKDGKIRWIFTTGGEKKYDFADYFQSTPVLQNDTLFFGSGDGNLYAVNAKNGKLIWSYKTGDIVHTTPAVDGDKIFFGSFDGYVYALNKSTGSLAWKFKTVGHRFFPKGEVQGSPAVHNGLVFIGARDYNVYALDQQKGYCHWNKAFTRGWGLNNNVHDSVLYIGTADERVLIAADPISGKESWKQNMEFLVFGNNAYSDSMLYLGTTMGKLHGIDRRTGKKIWTHVTDAYLKNRSKYFKDDDSYRDDIYSIIKSNEQFLDVECELGGVFSTPVIRDGFIFFTSTDGNLYCLKR
ncbi:MAG: PQQ-binding-like beta-propeller repeat protein [Bacteroidota bacterium]